MTRLRTLRASTLLLGSLLLAAPALAAPQTYDIDPVHSRVEFTIRHLFSKVTGNFGAFKGTILYDPASPASSSVKAEIDASSIDTNNDRRDGHLKSPDFFDVAKYPTLTFASTKVTPAGEGKFKIQGVLTMRGVSKPVTLDASFLGAGPGMDGVPHAGFEATTKVDRKDYGILWNKALDQGGTLLGDDVSINLEIEAATPKEEKASTAKAEK
ncbi:MAG TPA: YceI family protein [Candidatus Polarisedimenticolia bacterium]|nr:YceI family protein [Candidatus Polarisedimenticolia bacterium]